MIDLNVGKVAQQVYDFLSEVLLSRPNFDVVFPVFLPPLGILSFNRGTPCHLAIPTFIWIIVHSRDGFLGTDFAPLVSNMLSLGVLFNLHHCVRWFRFDWDQHVFCRMDYALTEIRHEDMQWATYDIIY